MDLASLRIHVKHINTLVNTCMVEAFNLYLNNLTKIFVKHKIKTSLLTFMVSNPASSLHHVFNLTQNLGQTQNHYIS